MKRQLLAVRFIKDLSSKDKMKKYQGLAKKYQTSIFTIYRLIHGKSIRDIKEYEIFESLSKEGLQKWQNVP
jgi:Mor family transcriptional regulator